MMQAIVGDRLQRSCEALLAALNLPSMGFSINAVPTTASGPDAGIWCSSEGTGNWLRYGEDFPNVRVTEIKIDLLCGQATRTSEEGCGGRHAPPRTTSLLRRSKRNMDDR